MDFIKQHTKILSILSSLAFSHLSCIAQEFTSRVENEISFSSSYIAQESTSRVENDASSSDVIPTTEVLTPTTENNPIYFSLTSFPQVLLSTPTVPNAAESPSKAENNLPYRNKEIDYYLDYYLDLMIKAFERKNLDLASLHCYALIGHMQQNNISIDMLDETRQKKIRSLDRIRYYINH